MDKPGNKNCAACAFASGEFNFRQHRCQRHAPEVRTVESWEDLRRHVPVWPIVKADDWCGDWQAK